MAIFTVLKYILIEMDILGINNWKNLCICALALQGKSYHSENQVKASKTTTSIGKEFSCFCIVRTFEQRKAMCYKDRECAIFFRAICSSHSKGVISIVVLLHCVNKILKHLFIFQNAVKNELFFFPLKKINAYILKGFFPFLRGGGLRREQGGVKSSCINSQSQFQGSLS